MKISYRWLKEYLDIDVPAKDLAEKIERGSVEIDSVEKPSDGLKKIVVGEVMSMEPHPDSDHLNICQVDIGEDDLSQIVCGAPNVAPNHKVIVALPGSRIGGNVKIKRSKMRGVTSNGMICALDEIGFSKDVVPKEWADGIYFLPDDAEVGEPVFPYLGMDDELIDVDVTPNRGDMLSVYGVANDVAALYDKTAKLNHPDVTEIGEKAVDQVTLDTDESLAPIYKMRLVKNVTIKPSPRWLQIKLWNAGVRPINNVVDVTNYILLKYGQPLHAFDFDKIKGNTVVTRNARAGEKLTTLDEEEHDLDANDIVIADTDKPIALAGVMGGFNSRIDDDTTTVAIESAVFQPTLIRKTAQRHNLHTDASQRFERGVNRGGVAEALDAAAQMMDELADGDSLTGIVTGAEYDVTDVNVDVTLSRINHVLGTELSADEVTAIFKRLGFGVALNGETYTVTVPPRRWDIHIEADLLEEVARIYGYDAIPSTLPVGPTTLGSLTDKQRLIRASRSLLEGFGLNQAISYALTTNEKAQQFLMRDTETTELSWPMTADHTTLRENLVSGLLDDVAYNNARHVNDIALYEQGRVFYREGDEVRPSEQEHIAGVISGELTPTSWQNSKAQKVDFYQLKGIVEQFLANLDVEGDVTFEATDKYPEMHPGRTADIAIHGHYVGFIGQVHSTTASAYKIKESYVFELNLDALIDMPKKANQYEPISKYPAVTRDIALLVDRAVTNDEILAKIRKHGGAYLKSVKLFDVYAGKNLPVGKQSMAYTLTYQNPNDTLTDDEVNQAFAKVEKILTEDLHAEIR
ncbi:phenylalanine--tRNA ligase subunit beta [Secundilactobacillus paracollinoides]|uniref:phenylalanine--tRNA ligase subunit beta n=1 Tax=Secundilactobacillus paracollinoides TaxID=240427 RepID=UPI00081A3F26|nr:phenylalanine--tRNA ligase subunit beta [Secundilactobacillus paracollinoides]ANZ63866.1 phenylalanine--tRNA ligase subunit beta [Secundilactobacillus paracollinoides]